MKHLFLSILMVASLAASVVSAQDSGTTISISGDSGTEQAAKLELIRVLQERLNKLTVSQLNARVIVSSGVTNYYKVAEIYKMQQQMYSYRTKYAAMAQKLETANSGFSAGSGNAFTYKYLQQFNAALETANVVKKQLDAVLRSGNPIVMPQLPTFSISSGPDPAQALSSQLKSILDKAGISSADQISTLPAAQQEQIKTQMNEAMKAFGASFQQGNSNMASTIGGIVGGLFGVPGIGSALGSLFGGGGSVSGLVGSITDQFQIPTDYYDSPTLKLTDAERLKIIDELHVRISETYQQTMALGANMSSETAKRYNEISQPRNETLMYGPKKP